MKVNPSPENIMNCELNGVSICQSTFGSDASENPSTHNPTNAYTSVWDVWQNCYYPQVIHTSYPVYLQEKSKDCGKQAFEIIKALSDKKMIKMDKVSDFIAIMDLLIKIL